MEMNNGDLEKPHPACARITEFESYSRFPNIRRFLFGLLATSLLLSWGLGAAAEGVNTFEGNGVIQRLDPLSELVVIDGQRYALPTAVALQATDRHGAKVMLKRGMLVSFYGSILSRTRQIQGINFLRWSDQ